MQVFWQKLRQWDDESRHILQKTAVVVLVLFCIFLFSKVLPFIAPFVLAAVLAMLIHPLVRLLERLFARIHFPRFLATLICMVLVLGLLLLLATVVLSSAFMELKGFAAGLPSMVSDFVGNATAWAYDALAWLEERVDLIPPEALTFVEEYVADIGKTIMNSATGLANGIARRAVSTAISFPQILLFTMLSILGTFYFSYDRVRIMNYLREHLPLRARGVLGEMKQGMLRAVVGQIRAEMILTLVLFFELLIGFMILDIRYAVLLALVVAIMGPLPVVGPGLVILPWSVYGFVTGDLTVGIGMLVIFIVSNVMRELLAPRVVSAQLGIYPMATMVSMYAGYVYFGVFGLLLGPFIFMLCRVAIAAVTLEEQEIVPPANPVERVRERAQQTVNKFQQSTKKKKQDDSRKKK